MHPILKLICFFLLLLGNCAKVQREYTVQLPANTAANEMSQSSVFELRNSALGFVDVAVLNQLLKDLKDDLSNKEFSDASAPKSKPTNLLGGKLTLSHEKTVAKICIQDLEIKPSGDGGLDLALEVTTCALNLEIHNSKAQLRYEGTLSDKPISIHIQKFKLKESVSIKSFVLNLRLDVRRDGQLEVSGQPRIEGLDQIAIADNYDYEAEASGVNYLSDSLNRSKDEIIAEVIKQILKSTTSFLENSLRDSSSRSLKKFSEKFNERQSIKTGGSVSVNYNGFKVGLLAKLNGIFATDLLGIAFNLSPFVELSKNETSRVKCLTDVTGVFPTPQPSQLRQLGFIKSLSENLHKESGAKSKETLVRSVTTGTFFPSELLNYISWKVWGTEGTCSFVETTTSAANPPILFRYRNTPKIVLTTPAKNQEGPNAKKNHGTLKIQFPDMDLRLSDNFAGLATNSSESVASKIPLSKILMDLSSIKDLSYEFNIVSQSNGQTTQFQLAITDEQRYLDRPITDIHDLIADLNRKLVSNSSLNEASFDVQKNVVAQALLESMLNAKFAANRVNNPTFTLANTSSNEQISLTDIRILREGIWLTWRGTIPPPNASLPLTQNDALGLMNSVETLTRLTDLTPTQAPMKFDQLASKLSSLGIPIVVGRNIKQANELLLKEYAKQQLICEPGIKSKTVQIKTTAAQLGYFSCFSSQRSIEHRFHSSSPEHPVAPEQETVAFQQIRVHDTFPGAPYSHVRQTRWKSIPDELTSLLGTPEFEKIDGRFINTEWNYSDIRLRMLSYCNTEQQPCKAVEKSILELSVWKN